VAVGGDVEAEGGHRVGNALLSRPAARSSSARRREFVVQILGGSGSALDVPDPTTVLDIVDYPGAPEGDAEAFLKPDTVHTSFAQDLPEADRWLIVAGQRPITLGADTTPSCPPAWKTLPSWAVVGTEDRVIPPDTQRRLAERAGATITDVAASHDSMVSHPQASLDAILAAAAAVEG
jgi:pimeloyl-ACP methyl ester carboxylesterase